MAANRRLRILLIGSGLFLAASLPSHAADSFEAKIAALQSQLPEQPSHHVGVPEGEASARQRREANYKAFVQEKLQGTWFAALTAVQAHDSYSLEGRFETWKGLMEFLLERDALVEVWAYPEAGMKPRRIPATELTRKQERSQPTFVTITYQDSATRELITVHVEFGFKAASEVLAASLGYRRHRDIQIAAREVLGSRDRQARFSALAQWEQLTNAAHSGRLPLAEIPPRPTKSTDLFTAFEYEVDAFNNFTNVVRVYRASEIARRVVEDSPEFSSQVLILQRSGEQAAREVRSFRMRGASDELEPAPNPVPGQDTVELRVTKAREPDARKWNVLDFGEPALLEQTSLAKFSLISAFLEKKRKEIAIRKSNVDLIAEPIIAGLNITY